MVDLIQAGPNLAGGELRRALRRGTVDEGAGSARWRRGRREYGGDEVEAVKLFLTGDDEVAAALGFEKLELERGPAE